MKTPLLPLVVVAAITVSLAACNRGSPEAEQTGSGTRAVVTDAPALDDVVAATWELGLAAARTGQGTVVVSPSSLVSGLAMLAEGATGTQTAPFDAALGAAGHQRTDAVNMLLAALGRYDGDPAAVRAARLPSTPVLHTAQRVVLDDDPDHAPAQGFLDRLQRGYGAGVLTTDLGSATGTAALSAWIEENTGGLVKRTAIVPDPTLVAVLQDAFVLAAAWQYPFDPAATYDADFAAVVGTDPSTVTVQVPTMHNELRVPVVQADGWQAVRLPYTDDLSADLLLPPSREHCPPGDCPVWTEIDPTMYQAPVLAGLSAALDDAAARDVKVALPVLDLATTTDLMDLLTSLGIVDQPLTGVRADGGPVVVGQAVQQAVLKVAEDGTRAAAVTEIAAEDAGAEPPEEVLEVRFDRPFILVIRDGTTGWPVLLAVVTDPR
ncbi:MAG: serpin family protein [Micrococcales bacterium]|nr:serpin family protein [Micrococcales bacterium]